MVSLIWSSSSSSKSSSASEIAYRVIDGGTKVPECISGCKIFLFLLLFLLLSGITGSISSSSSSGVFSSSRCRSSTSLSAIGFKPGSLNCSFRYSLMSAMIYLRCSLSNCSSLLICVDSFLLLPPAAFLLFFVCVLESAASSASSLALLSAEEPFWLFVLLSVSSSYWSFF